jgi:hypothetical protein
MANASTFVVCLPFTFRRHTHLKIVRCGLTKWPAWLTVLPRFISSIEP